jgi:hypothetical protein
MSLSSCLQYGFLSPDGITGVSQDSQKQRTQSLTKISQLENLTIHTKIKVVGWVTKYKQHK